MKIDINKNTIIIEANNLLKRYQTSQLYFYGYFKSEDILFLKSQNLKTDILKTINYLDQENIKYDASERLTKLLAKISLFAEQQEELFTFAKDIKNGIIDEASFLNFQIFLNDLPRKLKSHQIKAAFHLYSLKNGANFSVPGSGKTSVVLSVYEKLKREGEVNMLFVVGPPASFQPWQHEFESTLGRRPSTKILAGGKKNNRKSTYYASTKVSTELYLTTFQSILNDYNEAIYYFSQKAIKPYLVIDEAHYMKQIDGSWANTLLQIAKYSSYKCILTGTPLPKSYKDIFNLFDFLYPENSPLSEEDKIQINYFEKTKKEKEVKLLLDEKIGPLFYRVRKKDLGLKEAIFNPPIIVKMDEVEKRIYTLIKSKLHQLSTSDYLHNEELLMQLWRGRMIRLRQCVSYPKLLLKAINNYSEDVLGGGTEIVKLIQDYDDIEVPSKIKSLMEIVENLHNSGKKVLIWSNFIGTLFLIKKELEKRKIRSAIIYGKTPVRIARNVELQKEKTREQIRDEFVDSDSGLDVLIANPAAASESISLHKTCFHAVYYDLSYNAAQYLQSLDRIHRVGGSEINPAYYYFLQYENSIDQDVKINLENKAKKMYSIIEKDYEIYNLDMFEESIDDDIAAYQRIFSSR